MLLGIVIANPSAFRRLVVAGVGRKLLDFDPDRLARVAAVIGGAEDPEELEARHCHFLVSSPDVDRAVLGNLIGATWHQLDVATLGRVLWPVLIALGDADFAGPADQLAGALLEITFKVLRNVDHFATSKRFDFIDAAPGFFGVS